MAMKANAPVTYLLLCLALTSTASAAGPAASAPPIADWRDAPMTAGDWHWQREGLLSVARYGNAAGGVHFSLTCDRADHAIILRRSIGNNPSSPEPITITTTDMQRMIDSNTDRLSSGQGQGLSARLDADDPLLDAMAFSRGRFMVETPESATLYLPSWAEVSRVIEDCR